MTREASLPPLLQEVAEVAGLPAAVALAEHWGGVRLYVPQRVPPDHILAQRLGQAAADALAARFGLEEIPIPRAAAAARARRNADIRERHAAGESAPRLARAYGLTERQIWNIVAASNDGDDRQTSLL